jgi:hypothetical protein
MLCMLPSSCTVEQRLMQWSYTDKWYYDDGTRYQVYKTLTGREYIIIVANDSINLKRKYLKKK